MRRTSRFAVLAIVSLLLIMPATVGAKSAPRLPSNAADWATFSNVEREAALRYERQLLESGLRNGTVRSERFMSAVRTVRVGLSSDTNAIAGTSAPLGTLSLSISAACGFSVHFTGGGRWVGGGGYTDTNDYVYHIYASRPGKLGQLFRDGNLNKNWQQELYNTTHAENWSSQDFSWSWEHPTYVVKGWHGVQQNNGGSYQLGPDAYCTHTYTP